MSSNMDLKLNAPAPTLETYSGQVMATSLQVAAHFGKRHADVIRAIRNLGCSEEFTERNFAFSEFVDSSGRSLPMFHITRDGFAMLAMGFTGKEAMRWKETYITSFNAMEAKLRALYVEPLLSDKALRQTISLRDKLKLQEQSHQIATKMKAETNPAVRRNLYWQLRQVNDALGIPTESAAQWLGADAIFTVQETEF